VSEKGERISHKVSFIIVGAEAERFYKMYEARQRTALQEKPPRRVDFASIDREIYLKGLGFVGAVAPSAPVHGKGAIRPRSEEDRKRVEALLKQGKSVKDVAAEAGVPSRTVHRWKKELT